MKLMALDQIHVSAVQSDSLRPGKQFEVSDELGSQLLTKHPQVFQRLDKPKAAAKPRPMAKVARKPRNKAKPASAEK
ncbi:hypothetical protein [Phenylobacterium sp.]|uniref:hypothetical protein n=1 Tax=Phenylobacterium sp. TaxID=1871053 RepID=UPI0039236347